VPILSSRTVKLLCGTALAITFATTSHANFQKQSFKEDPHYDYMHVIQCYEDLAIEDQTELLYGKQILMVKFRNEKRDSLRIRNDLHFQGGVLKKDEVLPFSVTERPGQHGKNTLSIEFSEALHFDLYFSSDHYHLKTNLTKKTSAAETENIANMICAISIYWQSRHQ
jgi:hypothetical protein